MKLKGFITGIAAVAMSLVSIVACQEQKEETPDTLSVEPNKAMSFKAKGNEDVILKVTTNAGAWDFTAPEWITGTKGESSLTLKVADNTAKEERLGRIVVTAGKAAPVKIAVSQAAAEDGGEVEPSEGPKATLVAETSNTYYLDAEFKTVVKVKMTVAEAAKEEVQASLELDGAYLSEYEFITGNDYELFPEGGVALEGLTLTIAAGATESNEVEIQLTGSNELLNGIGYLVPLQAKAVKNVSFDKDSKRANFVVMRKNNREVKNVLYFEVNDVNPLNALEYVLEDGTPFFDAVILFAANINYDGINDVVYLHNNPNVQALLDESDVYLQPLRKKGIKVYLGLLGNHDAAGLCQLSDWGAEQWAKEVALACKEYKLDGVNLDDEYSSYPISGNKWFTSPSSAAGSRLCYELKKALKEECYWPTEVSYFVWGSLYNISPVKDQHTGVEHSPASFVDFYVANYGSASSPHADFTMKNCSGKSIELNRGYGGMSVQEAQRIKEDGYGWVMWFAFNPAPGSHTENRGRSVPSFRNAAEGLYGQKLLPEKNYYKKLGEGKYDPNPYPFQ